MPCVSAHGARELRPIHDGHHRVGQHKVDLALAQRLESESTIDREADRVTTLGQHVSQQVREPVLVLEAVDPRREDTGRLRTDLPFNIPANGS